MVKNSPANAEDAGLIPESGRSHGEGSGTPLHYFCLGNPTWKIPWMEKEMATHSSGLAWRIPGTGEPGGLLSMGSHRVGHD